MNARPFCPPTGSPDALLDLTTTELTGLYCRRRERLAFFRLREAPESIISSAFALCEYARIALQSRG